MPLAGAAIGAASGAIGGRLTDVGINDQLMRDAAQSLQSGNVALFLLVRKTTTDKVLAALQVEGGAVFRTSKEGALRAALAGATQFRATDCVLSALTRKLQDDSRRLVTGLFSNHDLGEQPRWNDEPFLPPRRQPQRDWCPLGRLHTMGCRMMSAPPSPGSASPSRATSTKITLNMLLSHFS
jgi:hypothetical protein